MFVPSEMCQYGNIGSLKRERMDIYERLHNATSLKG